MVDIKLFRSLFLYTQYLWLRSAPSAFSTAKYSVSCSSLTLDKKLVMGHSDVKPAHSMVNSLFSRGYTLPWSKYSLLKHFRHLQTHTPLFLSKATCSVILKHDKHTVTMSRKFKKLKKKKSKPEKYILLYSLWPIRITLWAFNNVLCSVSCLPIVTGTTRRQ